MLSNTNAIRRSKIVGLLASGGAAGVPAPLLIVSPRRSMQRLVAFSIVVLAAAGCAMWASVARAERSVKYVESGQVATVGEAESEVSSPQHLVVDEGHKTLVVADTGHNRLVVYSLAGSSPVFQQAVGGGTLTSPYGVALDEADKYLYVSDAGNGRILRYTYSSGSPAVYTLDKTFPSPPAGSKVGQVGNFTAALAVDPTTHDLLVADQGNHVVDRFSATGAFVNSFTGDSTGAPFSGPTDVAVGADGTTYVMDLTGSLTFLGVSRLERYNAADEWLGPLTAPGINDGVAVNRVEGIVYAGGYVEEEHFTAQISGIQGEELVGSSLDPMKYTVIFSLAVDDAANGKIYASIEGSGIRQYTVTPLVPAATVAIAAPTATATSIHVSGTVDAGNAADTAETSVRLEYSTDNLNWTPSTQLAPLTGSGVQPVAGDITGLAPHTQYYVRIAAIADATVDSEAKAIVTGSQAPAIENRPVNDLTSTSAAINVRINPLGLLSTYHYEYGTSTTYGQRLPLANEAVAGTGHAPVPLTVRLGGLTPRSTYHYRIVAQSAAGTSYGDDATFATPGTGEGPPVRVYEQVTPVDKHGAVLATSGLQRVGEGAESFAYQSHNASDSSASGSSPIENLLGSFRGPDGWAQYGYNVPASPSEGSINVTTVLGISRDLTHELVLSDVKLAEGAVEDAGNIYLRNVVTGQIQLIEVTAHSFVEDQRKTGEQNNPYAGTSNYSKIFLTDEHGLEEWSGGALHHALVLPDGSALEELPYHSYISEDASTVGFEYGGVYVRQGGHTIPISLSHRPGDDPTVVHAASLGAASKDGRYYFFTSQDPLTAEAPVAGPSEFPIQSAYRYDLQTGALEWIGANVAPVLASRDGESAVLEGPQSLLFWRGGHVKTIEQESEVILSGGLSLSPNGRYVAFSSRTMFKTSGNTTPYDNRNIANCSEFFSGGYCNEIYAYDAQAETFTCASCPADGAISQGNAELPNDISDRHQSATHVTDLGQVFFSTPTALVPEDANGVQDTYEYQDGETRLVSPGTRAFLAHPGGSTPDGRDVFFTTEQQLVAQDTDTEPDVYDARVGGGISSQNQDHTPPPECGTGQCPEALGGGTVLSALVASVNFVRQSVSGSSVRAAAAKVKIVKKLVAGSSFTVSVTVPGKGRLVGSGGGVARVQRSVAKAGTYKLRFSLTAAQKRKLVHVGKLSVKVRVSFAPVSGASSSAVVGVSLKGRVSAKRAARTGGRAGR
jgi:DNA-binding beta-propeller fold protein YncE